MEVLCQLDICLDLKYINQEVMKNYRNQIETIAKLINGLKNYLEKQNPSSITHYPKSII